MAEVPVPEVQMNGGGTVALNPSEPVGSKRQRRPSVRLGDIGDQTMESHPRRATTKPWRFSFYNASGKPSKTRPLTNLTSSSEFGETLEGEGNNTDSVLIGSWKVKDSKKRVYKRNRMNYISRIDEGEEDVDEDYDGFRDFEVDNSESPIHSMGNLGDDDREGLQHYHHQGNVRDRNNGRERCGEDGVRIWLNGLGLSRYAPVFQIHEVDDEVLPLLTLEDLKDMGINAVGSRRKMYCAIQKLGKGFS